MNIVQVQDQLKNFSQDQLVREMQTPSGNAPQYLVLSEIMRRQKMQQDFAAQKAKGEQGTVAQDAIAAAGVPQGGIADMARAMAPSTDMTQNTGVQAMAAGGTVRKMAEGDLIVRGGKRYVEQEDGSYLSEDGADRIMTPSQSMARDTSLLGDTLSGIGALFRPAPGKPPVEQAKDVGSAVSDAMTSLRATPEEDYAPIEVPVFTDPNSPFTSTTTIPPVGAATPRVEAPSVAPPAAASPMKNPRAAYVEAYDAAKAAEEDPMAAAAEQSATDAAALRDAAGITESLQTPDQIAGVAAAAKAAQDAKRTTQTAPPAAPDGGTSTGGAGGAGGAGGTGGTGGAGGAGGVSSYEQELMNALGRREKAAEQDKWLALAQVGLNLMSSTQPTIGGALGEAGLKGVEAVRSARDQYDKDRLELLGAMEQSRMARAKLSMAGARGTGGLKPLSASGIMTQQKYMLDLAKSKLEALTMGQSPSAAMAMLTEAAKGGDAAAATQLTVLQDAADQYDSAYNNYMSAATQLGALTMTASDAPEPYNAADE